MEGKRFIRTLRLQNFLSYGSEGETIELRSLNVLVRANASGKSNLIEAIALLKDGSNLGLFMNNLQSLERSSHAVRD